MALEENAETFSYKKVAATKFKKLLGTKVQVSRYTIPIVYCKDLVVGGDHCAGCYDYINRCIYINIESPESVVETFFHEVFHAEIIEGGVRQHPLWCKDVEEIVVEILSRSIAFGFLIRARNG